MSESAEKKPKSAKGKFLLVGALLVVVLAGGGGGYWWFVVKPAAAQAAEAAAHADGEVSDDGTKAKKKKPVGHEGGAVVKFDPFVVNLADGGGSRFLRVGLSLVISGDEDDAKHLEESKIAMLRIRSEVIELLAQQRSDDVVTPAGKKELKEQIEAIASDVLDPIGVDDVLFTEFVVQF